MLRLAAALAALAVSVAAKDPAEGWMGYATGTAPDSNRVTYIEAKWKVPADPKEPGAFFSPWFGIESSDNLDLIQPVNPWEGESWSVYNEQFEWDPPFNRNSPSFPTKAGNTLFGSVTYIPSNNTYTVYHSDLTSGRSVTTSFTIQEGKTYNILYFVMEKSQWRCSQYPANGKVVFFDIKVEYDNKPVKPTWTTAFVDDNCDCRAHITSESSITITWDTSDAATNGTVAEPITAGTRPASLHSFRA